MSKRKRRRDRPFNLRRAALMYMFLQTCNGAIDIARHRQRAIIDLLHNYSLPDARAAGLALIAFADAVEADDVEFDDVEDAYDHA